MLNNVVLMGRLVADPELNNTQSGVEVCSFRIAVERNYAKNGEERQTDFINCVAWRHAAAFLCKYFSKGNMVALVGEIQTRSYEDKDGNKRTATEVLANSVRFCGGKSENNTSSNETTTTVPAANDLSVAIDDDLPF